MVLETVQQYEVARKEANSKAKSLGTPSIKFHPGANLVIIIGEPEAVAVGAKVIGALPGTQRSVASDASGDPYQKIEKALKRLESDRFLR
jgi:hypothetical protein